MIKHIFIGCVVSKKSGFEFPVSSALTIIQADFLAKQWIENIGGELHFKLGIIHRINSEYTKLTENND